MYQIKRNHIVEEIEFDDNGKTLNVKVDINVDTILQAYTKAQYGIARASEAAKKAASDKDLSASEEAMGAAVLNLFEVVFGEDQTRQIIDFYDNRPMEMLTDIAPFITNVVAPKIEEGQARIEESYKQVSRRGK